MIDSCNGVNEVCTDFYDFSVGRVSAASVFEGLGFVSSVKNNKGEISQFFLNGEIINTVLVVCNDGRVSKLKYCPFCGYYYGGNKC